MTKTCSIAILCAGILALSAARSLPVISSPSFRADPACFYWTESAFHYHFAKTASETGTIPRLDIRAQYPEGIRPYEDLTPAMDLFYGKLHRLRIFASIPFHVFLVAAVTLWSSLSIAAVWLTAYILTLSPLSALLSAGIFGLSCDFLGRAGPSAYLREEFALVFFFFGFALLTASLKGKKRTLFATGAGMCFALCLASWHMAQFLIIPIFAGLAWQLAENDADKTKNEISTLLILCAFLFFAAFAFPHLRAKSFQGSPAFLLPLSIAAGWSTASKAKWNRSLAALAATAVFLSLYAIARYFAGAHFSDFSHVYALLAAKLRFPAGPPADPSRIPYDARFMWSAGYVAPAGARLFFSAFPVYIAATACWTACGIRRRKKECSLLLFAALPGACFLALFFLMERFSPIAIFFAAVSISMLPVLAGRKRGLLILTALLIIEAAKIPFTNFDDLRPPTDTVRQLTGFLRAAGTPDDPVLAPFPMGPSILVYAEKPTVLHSNVESEHMRRKIRIAETTLYRTEKEFFELCRAFGARYFVYDAEELLSLEPGSTRYVNAVTAPAQEQAVYAFHFHPEHLRGFRLIFQNDRYRVFEISATPELPSAGVEYQPLFDPRVFGAELRPPDDDTIRAVLAKLNDPWFLLGIAARLRGEGKIRSAKQVAVRVAKGFPYFPGGSFAIGLAEFAEHDDAHAAAAWKEAFRIAPLFPFEKYEALFSQTDISTGAEKAAAKIQKFLLEEIPGRNDAACFPAAAIRARLSDIENIEQKQENHLTDNGPYRNLKRLR